MALIWKLNDIIAFLSILPDLHKGNGLPEQRMVGPDDPYGAKNRLSMRSIELLLRAWLCSTKITILRRVLLKITGG